MSRPTGSERLFERFLRAHDIAFRRVPEGKHRSPDHRVVSDEAELIFEVKEIAKDEDFKATPLAVSSRAIGSHVRAKIREASGQVKPHAARGIPTVLLIFNALDPMQLFGTEPHDFEAALFGDWTMLLDRETGTIRDTFRGRNASFRAERNTSFSAVGLIAQHADGIRVTLHANPRARAPLPFADLPERFEVMRHALDA